MTTPHPGEAKPLTEALDALERARRFIKNGIEFGRIQMPDADCPDPAHQTPGIIDAAIQSVRAALAAHPAPSASAPAQPVAIYVPPDVLKAAQEFLAASYRGPVPGTRKVFDWIVGLATPTESAPESVAWVPEHLRKTRGGQPVGLEPLHCESEGASDYCMHCGRDMGLSHGKSCDGLERERLALIPAELVAAYGCALEAKAGIQPCESWCKSPGCPVSLKKPDAATHPPAVQPVAQYQGPKKFTAEEQARGNVGIRWVTATGVAGRPTSHDVLEYLKERGADVWCDCSGCASSHAALSTAAQPVVPAGWKLVPVEPTLAMGWAYLDAANADMPLTHGHNFNWAGYRALIAAAPSAALVDAEQPLGVPAAPSGSSSLRSCDPSRDVPTSEASRDL